MAGDFGIVCFGRGIQKSWDDERGMWWLPTTYLEKLKPDGQRNIVWTPDLELENDDDHIIVAGAFANVMATADLVENYADGCPPLLLSWAAGRPKYLEQEPPELTEGKVLSEAFYEIRDTRKNWKSSLAGTQIVIQSKNCNTRDDLLQSLQIARDMGLANLVIVSVLVHLPRIREFYKIVLQDNPFDYPKVEFKASELVLFNRGYTARQAIGLEDPEIGSQFFNDMTLAQIIGSSAYRRTAAREAKGIEDLRAGRYKF